MALRGYLIGEIVEDATAGLLTRREALRRLGLLGLGATTASTFLAACSDDDDRDDAAPNGAGTASSSTAEPSGDSTTDSPADTTADESSSTDAGATGEPELIHFDGPGGELQAVVAEAAEPLGAVLVLHENSGLTTHFYDVVGRLAADGYTALCVDLLSREGGTEAVGGSAGAQAGLGRAPLEDLLADLRAGLDELEQRAPGFSLGAVGFCFGGGLVWSLLDDGEPRLAAAAPFYGPAPSEPDFSGSDTAVLGVYAEQDSRVNASRDTATAALETADLTHEIVTYPGVGHAFFNDTGPRYNAEIAAQAYGDLLDWFGDHLTS